MPLQWKTLTLGHLSRNKFWGESDTAQYHSVVATTTLVQTDGVNILVDPTLPIAQTEALLRLHAGLGRADIHMVYATHFHGDHRVDAADYPNAKLYMSAATLADGQAALEEVKQGRGIPAFVAGLDKFSPAPQTLAPGVQLYPLPGHTDGNTGLMLDAPEGKVLLAGDTIMGEEYFCAGEGYWFNTSAEKTHASIIQASKDADLVVPGHGDWFLTQGRSVTGQPRSDCWWYRLNLGSSAEETVILVCTQKHKILINPSLPGHRLREALYDRTGLEPSAITHVLCLDGLRKHRLDVETLKNAVCLMPAGALAQQHAASCDPRLSRFSAWDNLSRFSAWDNQVPELTVAEGVCLFQAPEGTVAVTAHKPSPDFLRENAVRVLVCEAAMNVLEKH